MLVQSNTTTTHCKMLVACFATASLLVIHQQLPAAPALESFDNGLLTDDLDGLLEGLEEERPSADPAPAGPPAGEDVGQSPFGRIELGMEHARGLLRAGDTSGRAAGVQKQVISDLDELIRQAEKQCAQCKQGSSSGKQGKQQSQRSQPKPGQQAGKEAGKKPGEKKPGDSKPSDKNGSRQAAQQSTAAAGTGTGESSMARQPAELMKEVWGRLPQRLREQMLESSSDEFLPQYREQIEKYFERLAAEPDESE